MKIYIRPITLNDTPLILKWRNTPAILEHCFTKEPITEESHSRFFQENILTGKYKQFIVERIDDDFSIISYSIATIYLKDIDNLNHRCQLCLFTSSDSEWNHKSQILAIKLVLEKAFNEYGMHKVYSYVLEKYQNEADILLQAGFKKECQLINESLDNKGQYENVIRLSIFKNNYNHGS